MVFELPFPVTGGKMTSLAAGLSSARLVSIVAQKKLEVWEEKSTRAVNECYAAGMLPRDWTAANSFRHYRPGMLILAMHAAGTAIEHRQSPAKLGGLSCVMPRTGLQVRSHPTHAVVGSDGGWSLEPGGALHIDYEDVEMRRCWRGGRGYWLRQWTAGAVHLMQPHLSLAADVMDSNVVRCGALMALRCEVALDWKRVRCHALSSELRPAAHRTALLNTPAPEIILSFIVNPQNLLLWRLSTGSTARRRSMCPWPPHPATWARRPSCSRSSARASPS